MSARLLEGKGEEPHEIADSNGQRVNIPFRRGQEDDDVVRFENFEESRVNLSLASRVPKSVAKAKHVVDSERDTNSIVLNQIRTFIWTKSNWDSNMLVLGLPRFLRGKQPQE
jgi:hypothetical protein